MELIYVWVEEFRNIKQKGFSFSDRFTIEYDANDRELKVIDNQESKDYFDYFKFADSKRRVTNVSAIVGVNGCGKSNLLELIGGSRNMSELLSISQFQVYWDLQEGFYLEGRDFTEKGFFKNSQERIEKLNHGFLLENGFLRSLEEPYLLNLRPGILTSNDSSIGKQKAYSPFDSMLDDFNLVRFELKATVKDELDYLWATTVENNKSLVNTDSVRLVMLPLIRKEHKTPRINLTDKRNPQGIIQKVLLELSIGADLEKLKRSIGIKAKELFFLVAIKSYTMAILEDALLNLRISSTVAEEIAGINLTTETLNSYNQMIEYCAKIAMNNALHKEFKWSEFRYFLTLLWNTIPDIFFAYGEISIDPINSRNICEALLDCISLDKYRKEVVKTFLKEIDYNNILRLSKISDGEKQYVKKFSSLKNSIYEYLKNLTSNDYEENHRPIIILMDEPDIYLHPEWSRCFVQELTLYMNHISNDLCQTQNVKLTFQIILTSHSPFILSDLPSGNIIRLDKRSEENDHLYPKDTEEETIGDCIYSNDPKRLKKNNKPKEKYLAANIHELLSNKFFMKRTIGEYAFQTLNKVIKTVNGTAEESEMVDLKEALKFANQIAEPLVRHKITDMISQKLGKETQISEIDKEIERLQAKRNQLEKSND